jgi:hypothetical protein
LKHEDFDFDGADEIEDDDFYIYELKLAGGKLKEVFDVNTYVDGVAGSGRVTKSITTDPEYEEDDEAKTYFLADDVVVYVLKYDDDGDLAFSKVGSKSDIRNKPFMAYDVDEDLDGDYDIIVVYPEDYFDN